MGNWVVSCSCPSLECSQQIFHPVGEEQRKQLRYYGARIVEFNRNAQGNVPQRNHSIIRAWINGQRNPRIAIYRDLSFMNDVMRGEKKALVRFEKELMREVFDPRLHGPITRRVRVPKTINHPAQRNDVVIGRYGLQPGTKPLEISRDFSVN